MPRPPRVVGIPVAIDPPAQGERAMARDGSECHVEAAATQEAGMDHVLDPDPTRVVAAGQQGVERHAARGRGGIEAERSSRSGRAS